MTDLTLNVKALVETEYSCLGRNAMFQIELGLDVKESREYGSSDEFATTVE